MRYLKFLMREKVGNVIRYFERYLRENDGRMEEIWKLEFVKYFMKGNGHLNFLIKRNLEI